MLMKDSFVIWMKDLSCSHGTSARFGYENKIMYTMAQLMRCGLQRCLEIHLDVRTNANETT